MNLQAVHDRLAQLDDEMRRALESAASPDAIRAVETRLSKGPIAEALGAIKTLPADERGAAGKAVNDAKARLRACCARALEEWKGRTVAADQSEAARFDPTLPGPPTPRGSLHPVTIVQWEVERILTGLGFTVVGGPEMETDFYNFEALNTPATHPARDTMDTFWLENGWLLRTHTSPCQVRAMLAYGAPLRVLAPGRCFRYETLDASHENTFWQVEGLLVDRDISIAHLIGVMQTVVKQVFQRDVKTRLRPGYFPFVEPGFELDMSCEICGADGCPTCKQSGWVEVMPCGMVHPNVLRSGRIDPREYTGFAFGLGLTRLAMMKFGVADVRIMNSGDLRGLVSPQRLVGPAIRRGR